MMKRGWSYLPHGPVNQVRDKRSYVRVSVVVGCLFGLLFSAGASGQVSSSAMTLPGGATLTVDHEPLLLLPTITGGEGGWCVTPDPWECPSADPARVFRNPIVAESWSGQGPPQVIDGFVLATSDVAAVSVDGGAPIPTKAEAILPEHMRAVMVELRGGPTREVFGVEVLAIPLRSLEFTPLNAREEAAPLASEPRPPLQFDAPGLAWRRSDDEPRGICAMHTAHVAAIFRGGFVVTRFKSHIGPIGRPLLSCVSASYHFGGWPIVASVLVDAAHPGSTPGVLPGMKPLRWHGGVFKALAAQGEMLARRIHGAWLVVARGRDDAQRLRLLEHLHATVHL